MIVYGPNDKDQKDTFFRELLMIKTSISRPWLLGGDFKMTKSYEDRKGNLQILKDNLAFMEFISSINLDIKGKNFSDTKFSTLPKSKSACY